MGVLSVEDRDALVEMHSEGLSAVIIAQALGTSARTIHRWELRLNLREPHVADHLTEEEIQRIELLLDEGMPMTWIAEDLHRNPTTLYRVASGKTEHVAEWRAVWQEIRRSETLRDWHDQFFPKEGRRTA